MADSFGGDAAPAAPLEMADLVRALSTGEKPLDQHRIGAEHEKFVFERTTLARAPYEGASGIEALLTCGLESGWAAVREENRHGDMLIGLSRAGVGAAPGANISLEPGGQFELSGAPLADAHAIAAETRMHIDAAKAFGERLGLSFLALGHDPLHTRAEVPVMPKGRYDIMRGYMPKVGGLGLDMMLRTCTVQANLDFADEADMVAKFRTSLALQPVATALFANSPFIEGRPSGWLSTRARVWTDTDPDRTGLLDFVFEEGFGYARYVEYALDVPMYFVRRDGRYVDVAGRSFRRFLAEGLPELDGARATARDWSDHLTTIFPEVRLKAYLEMRGADAGALDMLCALPALWAGLLYDSEALAAAWDLARGWSREVREALRLDAARVGLKADVAGRSLLDVAREVLTIANAGLRRRARAGDGAADETVWLAPLHEIAASGLTRADHWLARYHGEWNRDVRRAYVDCAY